MGAPASTNTGTPSPLHRYLLVPAYDVLTTNSGRGYQEFIVGTDQRDSTLVNAMSQCELCGYAPAQAAADVARVIMVVGGWREHFAHCGVSDADLESLAERMDADQLRGQRLAFDPADYATRIRARCRSPFAK